LWATNTGGGARSVRYNTCNPRRAPASKTKRADRQQSTKPQCQPMHSHTPDLANTRHCERKSVNTAAFIDALHYAISRGAQFFSADIAHS
jgi:hypothetical protein